MGNNVLRARSMKSAAEGFSRCAASHQIAAGKKPGLVGSLGDNAELKGLIKADGWNDVDIIARGNTLIQILNGRVMSMLIDDDTANRKMEGLIGIQVHKGPPMKMEVRNIRIKNL